MGIFTTVGSLGGTASGIPGGGIIGAGVGGIVDSLVGGDGGVGKAAQKNKNLTDEMKEETKRGYNVGQDFLRPYEKNDNQAANLYSQLLTNPAAFSKFTTTPGYQFAMQQGTNAMQNGAAAKGGLLSGATLKGLQTYGQGTAEQYYNDYMNRLQGLQTSGQNLAVTNANLATQRGNDINQETAWFAGKPLNNPAVQNNGAALGQPYLQDASKNNMFGQLGGALQSLGGQGGLGSLFGGGGGSMSGMQNASFGLPGAAGGGSFGLPSGGLSNFAVG